MKEQYPKAVPSITIGRALAFTEVTQKYPDLPANLRIAKSFRRACETTPMLIQPDEPIVGHPCGKPRASAFSPDISWDSVSYTHLDVYKRQGLPEKSATLFWRAA